MKQADGEVDTKETRYREDKKEEEKCRIWGTEKRKDGEGDQNKGTMEKRGPRRTMTRKNLEKRKRH